MRHRHTSLRSNSYFTTSFYRGHFCVAPVGAWPASLFPSSLKRSGGNSDDSRLLITWRIIIWRSTSAFLRRLPLWRRYSLPLLLMRLAFSPRRPKRADARRQRRHSPAYGLGLLTQESIAVEFACSFIEVAQIHRIKLVSASRDMVADFVGREIQRRYSYQPIARDTETIMTSAFRWQGVNAAKRYGHESDRRL